MVVVKETFDEKGALQNKILSVIYVREVSYPHRIDLGKFFILNIKRRIQLHFSRTRTNRNCSFCPLHRLTI